MEDLKFVLGTIADIRNMSMAVEMRFTDIQERYRTLTMYNIEVCQLFLLSFFPLFDLMLNFSMMLRTNYKIG